MNKRVYDGFSFSEYLERFIKKEGITKSKIADLLDINYNTVKSKFRLDCFTYQEIHYLDTYYPNLHYWDNRNNYLEIRIKNRDRSNADFNN